MDDYDLELDLEAEDAEFRRLVEVGLDFPFHIVEVG